MQKPKILFVFYNPNEQYWMDGLYAALNLLEKDFEITRQNISAPNSIDYSTTWEKDYDFVLGWGAFGSNVDWLLTGSPKLKKGLCIAGNAFPPDGCTNYDVLFYETKWYRDQIKHHPNIVQAFGVNTDIFNQVDMPFPIIYDYIGVGALALWKRWTKLAHSRKGRRLVVGEFQNGNVPESLQITEELLRCGVGVSPMINPYDLAMLYHCSRTLYMPSDINGGGERAVLEARACGLQVEIEPDNPKLQELLDLPEVPDHFLYAKQLKKGILSCLN